MAELISGSRVWCWLKTPGGSGESWQPGVVLSDAVSGASAVKVKFVGDGPLAGTSCDVPIASALLQNAEGEDAQDMTTLTHLNEPNVLDNLNLRYGKDCIYTNTGSILIAINPFKRIPALVSAKVMQQYQEQGPGQAKLPPHVYSTAVSAYRQMLRDGAGQAILITGESGAGKTETCKLIMRCLAHLGTQNASRANSLQPGAELPGGDSMHANGLSRAGSLIHSSSSVERMVLESNPLLEAFGNAKTSRNDNSSRFGKYVEIQFDAEGTLQGAAIRTYLLERSRVVHVVQGERSFHAFYQVCAGASPAQRQAWQLGSASDYAVLRQSDCRTLVGVDDGEEFKATCHAMASVGLSEEQQDEVFALLAAILHMGNVRFCDAGAAAPAPAGVAEDGVAAVLHDAPKPGDAASWEALKQAARLLQVSAGPLLSAVSTRTRQTPDGAIVSPLSVAESDEARNALCKVLYARLFTWIVACVNASLQRNRTAASTPTANGHMANGNGHMANGNGIHHSVSANGLANGNGVANGDHGSPCARRATAPVEFGTPSKAPHAQNGNGVASVVDAPDSGLSIGLLDIYGFESFESNDLEQLCINLANEKLQQHFNQHVFKWEQAEYTREGVDWRYIDFVDNQEVLDLVEGKLGLLDLLDELCRFPKASADDLANKYSTTPSVTNSKRFEKMKRERTGFAIKHYAGPVNYKTDNFLEKNKDFVVAEHTALMSSSTSDLVSSLFMEPSQMIGGPPGFSTPPGQTKSLGGGPPGSATKSAFKFDSVASQFKRQLADLMAALHKAQPHYIRCIKPNPGNKAGVFDASYSLQQLKCGGVMEAVRISCAGFSYKRPYAAFLDYFWLLCPSALHDLRKHAPMRHCQSEGDVTAASRALMPASHLLQQPLPPEALKAAAEQVLKVSGVTGYHLGLTKLFLKATQAAVLEKLRSMVVGKATTKIQAAYRGYRARTAYQALREATIVLQARIRAQQARQLAQRLREERALLRVQGACLIWIARIRLKRAKRASAIMQAAWRARTARRTVAEQIRERAALVLQSAWRGRTVYLARQQEVRYHKAALCIQSYTRARAARREYKRLIPMIRSATIIQRAWRKSRAGEKLREKFREVVRMAMQLPWACQVMQEAWRVKVARRELKRLRLIAHRQRFTARYKMFEGATSAPQPVSPTRPKGPRPLLPYQIKALEAAKRREAGLPDLVSDTLSPRDASRAAPVVDQSRLAKLYSPAAVHSTPIDHLKELSDFKVGGLLALWQDKEKASAQKAAPTLVRDKSLVVRFNPQKSGSMTADSRSNSNSPASQSSYGQLLDMPPPEQGPQQAGVRIAQ